MLKNRIRTLLSWLMVLALLLNIISPLDLVYAGEPGEDKTSVIKGANLVTSIKQGEKEIEDGDELTSTEPITIEISFDVPVLGDYEEVPDPSEIIQKGDYAIFELSDAFSLVSGDQIELKTSGDILVGNVKIEKTNGMVTARVDFDGDEDIFSEDSGYHSVSCSFNAELEYDDSGDAGNEGVHTVQILEKTYTVIVPPVEIIYEVTKSGKENLADKYIEWTVDITATQDGEHIDLAGYEFFDNLASVGDYIDNSFKVGSNTATPVKDGSKISYIFPDDSTSPQTITFRTEIPDSKYYASSQQSVTNEAQLRDSEEKLLKDGKSTVTFTPQWIKKSGEPGGEYSNGDYNPTNRTITWTITANHEGADLTGVVITDVLPGGLTFESASWQKWNGSAWETATSITPVNGKYAIGAINTKIQLTIVTIVPDEAYTAVTTPYMNSASISWDGLPGTITAPGASVGVGVGYIPITKSGKVIPADHSEGIITWTVTVDPKGQTIPSPKVYDLLVYGKSINLTQVTGIPSGIATSALTPRYNQKYVDGTFSGADGLTLEVHEIYQSGVRVADLLEITEFNTAKETFTFKTQITDPDIYAGNKNSTLRNNAALFSGTTKLNEATNSVPFVSKTLAKEMLKRGYLADPAAGVNDYTTSASEGFDYQDKSVIFRLSINADGLDLTNMENAAEKKLGTATVTDTLPEGWEFVNIVEESKYLIFKGEKDGNTVKAIGSALVPAYISGFEAVFNAETRTATFTFEELNQPYVILVKARPNDTTLAGYFSKNDTWDEEKNTLTLETEEWTPGVKATQDIKVVSTILDKNLETSEGGVLKAGELRWTVDYRPYDLELQGTKLVDKLPVGVELRTDSSGNLLLSDGNITAHELNLNIDGSYTRGDEVDLVVDDNVFYAPLERTITFIISDGSQGYRFSYITDITGESGEITNEVVLYGGSEEQEETGKKYAIQEKDGWATLQRNGWIEITKVDGSTDAPLAGAEFTLYASDGETIIRWGITAADGTLRFKVIPDGDYIFRETSPPGGYTAEARDHTLTVATVEGVVTASIDGKSGNDANKITIKNYPAGTVGNLTISKEVTGNGADEEKEFGFTITFTGEGAGGEYEYFGEGVSDGMVKSGDKIYLAHGQRITITGLPKGMGYQVEEDDYRDEGYVTTPDGGETGTIDADETQKASFTNAREVGDLKISKVVSGKRASRKKKFDFTVTFELPKWVPAGTSYPYVGAGGVSGSISSEGGTISLAHGQHITIKDLPEGTRYTVTEGDYQSEGYITAPEEDEGEIEAEETRVAAFTNTRKVGDLKITKVTKGRRADKSKPFDFTVTFNGIGAEGTYSYIGRGVSNGTIQSGGTISLAHRQSITIRDLPEGITYTVKETDYREEGYFTTPDEEETGEIVNNRTRTVTFTNTRRVGDLKITKLVSGRRADRSKEFDFMVTFNGIGAEGTYSYIGRGVPDGTIESGGTISLAHRQSITIRDLPEGLTYTVSETDYRDDGYFTTPDEEETGAIVANRTQTAAFNNARKVGDLKITKLVSGNRADRKKKFDFTVYFEGFGDAATYRYIGQGVPHGEIKSGDTISLAHNESIVILSLPQGLEYEVVEGDYTEEGYKQSATGETGTIVDGKIAVAFFLNARGGGGGGGGDSPGNGGGDLIIGKTVAGRGAGGDGRRYTFTVNLTGAPDSYDYTGDGVPGGTIRSGDTVSLGDGETITISGLPEGAGYTVTEADYSADGYNTLSSGDRGTIDDEDSRSALFTNSWSDSGAGPEDPSGGGQDGMPRTGHLPFGRYAKLGLLFFSLALAGLLIIDHIRRRRYSEKESL